MTIFKYPVYTTTPGGVEGGGGGGGPSLQGGAFPEVQLRVEYDLGSTITDGGDFTA